ncbi:MAG: hypothetical protein OXJ64_06360 [Boseongicola sp.]|nr:hypothetical protein [Boseongicola sp.]
MGLLPLSLNRYTEFPVDARSMGAPIMRRADSLKRFYLLMDTLEERVAGMRRLSDCSGRMPWPKRGVYFFFEPGEIRTGSGTGPRVVRIGTHALKAGSMTTLWRRLSQHRGQVRSGGGNHRSSIFRLVMGTALMERDGIGCATWDNRRIAASRAVRESEIALERVVSKVIGDMPFLWLAVEDEPGPDSMRGYIERNAIALLSSHGKEAIDPPSTSWLGRKCNREKVRIAGLWNSNHVDENCDPAFLDTLATLVEQVEKSK